MSHPYRADAVETTALVAVVPTRRRFRNPLAWTAVIAMATVGLIGGTVGTAISTGLVSVLWLGACTTWFRRRHAFRELADLPFPIENDRPAAIEPLRWSLPIRTVTLTLREPPDPSERERIANAIGAGLDVRISDREIAIGAWSWGGDDYRVLVKLLTTWGVTVHEVHSVELARVEWGSSGPPLAG